MNKMAMVRLELSVDEMRHHVVHALAEHHGDIQAIVDDQVKQYAESGAMEAKIRDSVQRYMDAAIDDGVKTAISRWTRDSPTIKQAVADAVHAALWSTEKG